MQKWPYADLGYINREHFHFPLQKNDLEQKRVYLTVEAVFASENAVMFFDHRTHKYESQRSALDGYLEKLGADGWKLTSTLKFDGKGYQFRRYHFRRVLR